MLAYKSTLLALFLLLGACGASESKATTEPMRMTPPRAQSDTAPAPRTKEDKADKRKQSRLVAQHDALCDRVCRRLTECSIRYAEENLSPSVAAEMSTPAARFEQESECQDTRSQCSKSQHSQKDANQTGKCLRENNECAPLMACLD